MSVQEQAVQLIHSLSDNNVKCLIDFMKRFMLPEDEMKAGVSEIENNSEVDFMQEMEAMRIRTKSYFPSDFNSDKIWEEAMDKKHGSIN